jgi:hypothetical protein
MSNLIPQVVASDFFFIGHNNCEHVHNVHCTFATVSTPITTHDSFAIQDSAMSGSTSKLARTA